MREDRGRRVCLPPAGRPERSGRPFSFPDYHWKRVRPPVKKRFLYGSAIAVLAILVALVVWQGSFTFGEYAPADPSQTFAYWAISSLIFLLMVTLAFILCRNFVKLYVERRSNQQGSRIKTKLMIGALALSFMPVLFLFLFSYAVLNRNLDKWFSRPAEDEHVSVLEISKALKQEVRDEAEIQAALLETRRLLEEGIRTPGFLERFLKEQELVSAAVVLEGNGPPLDFAGVFPVRADADEQTIAARSPVKSNGKVLGYTVVASKLPLNIAEKQAAVERYNQYYGELARSRRQVSRTYLLLMALITLFILFVATWIALFLAKQISVPISGLLNAAGEVRKG